MAFRSVQTVFYADRIQRVAESKMPVLMTALATEYANEVKEFMRTSPASGRMYRRGRVAHRASAPGEPPAPDRGRLIQSVQWQVKTGSGGSWLAEAGSAVSYALYLEFGAARGVKGKSGRIEQVQWVLFPRPAWGPALERVRQRIPELIRTYARG